MRPMSLPSKLSTLPVPKADPVQGQTLLLPELRLHDTFDYSNLRS